MCPDAIEKSVLYAVAIETCSCLICMYKCQVVADESRAWQRENNEHCDHIMSKKYKINGIYNEYIDSKVCHLYNLYIFHLGVCWLYL